MPPPLQEFRKKELEKSSLEAKEWIEKVHPVIVDVRPSEMFFQGHIKDSKNIPIFLFPFQFSVLSKDKPILTVCTRGNDSYVAVEFLKKLGYKEVVSLRGGLLKWVESGEKLET
jgi:rhodanese-related sulfurtransferase